MKLPKVESVVATGGKSLPPVPSVQSPAVMRQMEKLGKELQTTRQAVAVQLERYLKETGRDLEFRVDTDANATVITVRRSDTGEVVRQFPTEAALAMLRRLNEHSGTFLDTIA